MALLTERRLFPEAHLLRANEAAGAGKSLLARRTNDGIRTRRRVNLVPISREQDWHAYADQRVKVEAGFGLGEADAWAMVSDLRDRADRIGLRMYFACDGGETVGALGRFRLPPPHRHWARLQEVDVFPRWRNQGYGNALLAATAALLAEEGSRMVVVGADEDDWPLAWYRRHGFHDVARVPITC